MCDARRKLSHDRCHARQFAALDQTKCTWAPTKRCCSPAEAVLVRKWVALPGFTEIVGKHPLVWMHMILTRTNALSTVEGNRLPQQVCTRCDTTFACYVDLTSQMSWGKEPLVRCAFPFYSCRSCDLAHAGMRDITRDIMTSTMSTV